MVAIDEEIHNIRRERPDCKWARGLSWFGFALGATSADAQYTGDQRQYERKGYAPSGTSRCSHVMTSCCRRPWYGDRAGLSSVPVKIARVIFAILTRTFRDLAGYLLTDRQLNRAQHTRVTTLRKHDKQSLSRKISPTMEHAIRQSITWKK
jgi:hypothetical protein